jgi:hypothetical protein
LTCAHSYLPAMPPDCARQPGAVAERTTAAVRTSRNPKLSLDKATTFAPHWVRHACGQPLHLSGKATVLPVATLATSLQSISYKPSFLVRFGKENAPTVSQLEKGKFLQVLGRPAKKFQDHLRPQTRIAVLRQFGGNSGIASPSLRGSEAP